jgi:hypothetical protein
VIIFVQIWTVQNRARKSTTHIGFRTPPSILPLTEGGGGGSGIGYKAGADLNGSKRSAQIDDPHWIPDPPLRSAFNGGGGSGIDIKERADLDGHHTSAQINGS